MTDSQAEDAADLAEGYPDPRITHGWDAGGEAMRLFQRAMGLPIPAWDVYLIYPAGVRWTEETPPAQSFWMHQLGRPEQPRVDGLYLDPEAFAQAFRQAAATP